MQCICVRVAVSVSLPFYLQKLSTVTFGIFDFRSNLSWMSLSKNIYLTIQFLENFNKRGESNIAEKIVDIRGHTFFAYNQEQERLL